ncbi:DUF4132 domain-containing protein [Actinomadura viridis]|uniref:DUF4132 domain-containing protein n=1 Tax=Actinomadura viridis TaxID=58110 RepID=UPI0036B95CD5
MPNDTAPPDGGLRGPDTAPPGEVLDRAVEQAVNEALGESLDAHMAKLKSPRPGPRWRDRTLELLQLPGVREHVREAVREYVGHEQEGPGPHPIDPHARGHVWAMALAGGPSVLEDLLAVVRHAGWVTRRCWDPAVANAAIGAIGAIDRPETLEALRGLEKELNYPGARKQIESALQAAAERRGITPGQLVERGVPAHGLGPDGSLTREVGRYQAVLAIEDPRTVRLTFTGDVGHRLLRTVPAALKDGHADEVKELKALAKEVRGTLADERARVEGLLTAGRDWPYAEWCRHYRDHPITGVVTRGLIWEFEGRDGVWRAATPAEEALVTVDGNALSLPDAGARVRLWHPIRATAPQVRAWRAFVTENEMVQPFKQAFREIYLLTPAEEETGVYSNRFAAHIVRYGHLYALFKERGWQSNHLGRHSDGYDGRARGLFAEGEWRACFFHEPAEEDFTYTPAHAATDQVRFERRNGRRWAEVPLAEVPAVVFSEAMRDVDLFVAVTSIAADPAWADRGEHRHLAYWRETTFGELTASAEVRRDALARILPRTRIAGRCSLDGRYLVVRGDLRTYRIHLGSANILMEPDDSYLCVVASRKKGPGKVFLPFEDERLALILSKAFLLAADGAITDETILRQIERGAR